MTNQFGATSWDIETGGGFKKENKKDEYLRLNDGDNVVRILTKPHEYLSHRFKPSEKDPGFGERVMSSKFHGRDILEEAPYNLKAKRRWILGCIDRKTNTYKILDISKSVFDGIRDLYRDEDWGPVENYDINIKVNKAGGPSGYYSVIPKSKKPLSASDLEIKQSLDLDALKSKCQPPTVEQMQARVNKILEKSRAAGNTPAVATQAVSTAVVAETAETASSDDSGDDFDFPAVG